jgi:ADP-heptose:LPS heptosyltransferase
MTPEFVVFTDGGGLGKTILSTAVVASISAHYPKSKIIVLTGHPDVYDGNPKVYRVFDPNAVQYFYSDYIKDKDFVFLQSEPYTHWKYLRQEMHLIEAWCDQIGVPCVTKKPEIFVKQSDKRSIEQYMKIQGIDKDALVLIQWCGGIVPKEDNAVLGTQLNEAMHKRSIPKHIAQEIADALKHQGRQVVSLQHQHQEPLDGVATIFDRFGLIAALIDSCKTFVGIDSFMQHAAAALGKSGTVLWGATNSDVLGYEMHSNLTRGAVCAEPKCHRPNSFLLDKTGSGQSWSCPYSEPCLDFVAKDVVEDVLQTKPKSKKK